MNPKRLAYVLVSMFTVAVFSMILLDTAFKEVAQNDKYLIIVSATVFSGIVAFLLFPKDREDVVDPKPDEKKRKN